MEESAALHGWVVARQPTNDLARLNLAASLLARGRGEAALAELVQLGNSPATSPALQNDLAVARLLTGQPAEGRRLLSDLAARQPGLPEARFNLGRALVAGGDPVGARREFLAFLALDDLSGWADLARQALSELPAP
jgi:Flp pilus assembly protein TadD